MGTRASSIDLRVAPAWTGGCTAPEGQTAAIPILRGMGGSGPTVGVLTDAPIRLILVDVGGGRTIAIVVACAAPSQPSLFDEQVAAAMPVIESMELHAPTP